jgi:exodeoxyribonuclease V alpha subunit
VPDEPQSHWCSRHQPDVAGGVEPTGRKQHREVWLSLQRRRQGLQIENNYDKDVYNGDIGFVTHIDPDEQELTATFDGHIVTYAFGELDELVLCYATTIHKSQGSEYPVVVIPISTQHYMMLKPNLIYTGITRGKHLVVLVGQKRALAIAVKGKQTERRWSKLAKRLCL